MKSLPCRQPDDGRIESEIARRLRVLRAERGWTLEDLASRSGSSRATLSRIECGDVSPTTQTLARICGAFGVRVSELLHAAEGRFVPLLPAGEQPVWKDPTNRLTRKSVSPPAPGLAGEVIEGRLDADSRIDYTHPTHHGLEHHLVLLEGLLIIGVNGQTHQLDPGDCLRYRLQGESFFETLAEHGARYLLFLA